MDNESDSFIIVMEYASHGNLEQMLSKSPPNSWISVWRIAKEITRRLQVIHNADLIHSDLHPGNIVFVGDNSNPMIIDIGISKTIEQVNDHGGVYGRRDYLPPEAFKSTLTVYTQKYDVYCLGTLLWMLTARFAPRGNAGSPPISAASGMRENPIPTTPTCYVEIYQKCWNLIPDDRPTVHQVLDALESIEMNLAQATWLDDEPEAVAYLQKIAECNDDDVMFSSISDSCSSFRPFSSVAQYYSKEDLLKQIYDEKYKHFERVVIDIELATTQLSKAMLGNRAVIEKNLANIRRSIAILKVSNENLICMKFIKF